MNRYYFSILTVLFLFCFITNNCTAEVLKARVSESTGIVGIDMIIGKEPVPIIRNVFAGTPAEKAGLKPNDRIVMIDHKSTYYLDSRQIDLAISDIPGTKVVFTILRGNMNYNIEVVVMPLEESSTNIQNIFVSNYSSIINY